MASSKSYSISLESDLPIVQQNGLNTNKATFLGSTLEVVGAVTFDDVLTASGGISTPGNITAGGSVTATGPITSGGTGTFASPLVVGAARVIVGALNQVAGPTGVSAPTGSIFLSSSGGTGPATRAFINNNGATGWTAITTAA